MMAVILINVTFIIVYHTFMRCRHHRKLMRNVVIDNDGSNDDSNTNYFYFSLLFNP